MWILHTMSGLKKALPVTTTNPSSWSSPCEIPAKDRKPQVFWYFQEVYDGIIGEKLVIKTQMRNKLVVL